MPKHKEKKETKKDKIILDPDMEASPTSRMDNDKSPMSIDDYKDQMDESVKENTKRRKKVINETKKYVKEATDVGTTKFVDVTITAGGLGNEKNVSIGQLNGRGQVSMDLLKQKGAYIKLPINEIDKLIRLLQKAKSMD